jgi:hypothetical protein
MLAVMNGGAEAGTVQEIFLRDVLEDNEGSPGVQDGGAGLAGVLRGLEAQGLRGPAGRVGARPDLDGPAYVPAGPALRRDEADPDLGGG